MRIAKENSMGNNIEIKKSPAMRAYGYLTMDSYEYRKNLSNEKIKKMDLKGVLLSDLIMEHQKQNGIMSIAQFERLFETVSLKTNKYLKETNRHSEMQKKQIDEDKAILHRLYRR